MHSSQESQSFRPSGMQWNSSTNTKTWWNTKTMMPMDQIKQNQKTSNSTQHNSQLNTQQQWQNMIQQTHTHMKHSKLTNYVHTLAHNPQIYWHSHHINRNQSCKTCHYQSSKVNHCYHNCIWMCTITDPVRNLNHSDHQACNETAQLPVSHNPD